MKNREKGIIGEKLALDFLLNKGYILRETNYRKKFGEIDIILNDGDILVFVEVKVVNFVGLEEIGGLVNLYKQQKIINVAKSYLQEKNLFSSEIRFDIVAVNSDNKNITQIKNAFSE